MKRLVLHGMMVALGWGVIGTARANQDTAEAVASGDWVTRKLALRQILLTPDPTERARLATELVEAVAAAPDRRAAFRLLLTARALDAVAAIEASRPILLDSNVTLQTRRVIGQLLAQDAGAAVAARAEMASLARELMSQSETETWAIGLRILGQCEPDEAWTHIQHYLEAGDDDQRLAAVSALSEHRYEQSWHRLEMLSGDPRRSIRRKAVKGLGLYHEHEEVIPLLSSILANETDTAVCSRAFEAAETLRPNLASSLLMERFDATTGCGVQHRYAILSGLRRILRREPNLPEAREFLLSVVREPAEASEAGYAAAALGDVALAESLGGYGALDGLVKLTSRSQETTPVRLAAIDALARLAHPDGLQRLMTLLGNVEESDEVLQHLLETLLTLDAVDPEAAFCAIPYTAISEKVELRSLAVQYLSQKGGGEKVTSRLVELLSDPVPSVSSFARQGLTRVVGADHGSDDGAWLEALDTLASKRPQETKAAPKKN